jgi:hypothetical protein
MSALQMQSGIGLLGLALLAWVLGGCATVQLIRRRPASSANSRLAASTAFSLGSMPPPGNRT